MAAALFTASPAAAQAPAATAAFPSSPPASAPEAAPPTGVPPESAPPGVAPPASSASAPPGYAAQPSGPPPGTYYAPSGPPSAAYPPPEPPEPPPRKVRHVSLTFSPLHLLIGPIFEVTVEGRLANHVGLAVIGGIGSYTAKVPETLSQPAYDVTFGVRELGGQLAFYPLEDFDSLTLGAEVIYLHLAGDLPEASATGIGAGTGVGPFVGYKLLTSGGFTLFVQGGFEYLSVSASATSTTPGTTTTSSASESRVIPLLNFNLGWSF